MPARLRDTALGAAVANGTTVEAAPTFATLTAELQQNDERAATVRQDATTNGAALQAAMKRVGVLVAGGANANELAAARATVTTLQTRAGELADAARVLFDHGRALRRQLAPLAADNALAATLAHMAVMDATLRTAATALRAQLPALARMAQTQAATERAARSANGGMDSNPTHALADVVGKDALAALTRAAVAVLTYTDAHEGAAFAQNDTATATAPAGQEDDARRAG